MNRRYIAGIKREQPDSISITATSSIENLSQWKSESTGWMLLRWIFIVGHGE